MSRDKPFTNPVPTENFCSLERSLMVNASFDRNGRIRRIFFSSDLDPCPMPAVSSRNYGSRIRRVYFSFRRNAIHFRVVVVEWSGTHAEEAKFQDRVSYIYLWTPTAPRFMVCRLE